MTKHQFRCCTMIVLLAMAAEAVVGREHHFDHTHEVTVSELLQPLPQIPTMPITGSAWR
jgi:hypothetical protein